MRRGGEGQVGPGAGVCLQPCPRPQGSLWVSCCAGAPPRELTTCTQKTKKTVKVINFRKTRVVQTEKHRRGHPALVCTFCLSPVTGRGTSSALWGAPVYVHLFTLKAVKTNKQKNSGKPKDTRECDFCSTRVGCRTDLNTSRAPTNLQEETPQTELDGRLASRLPSTGRLGTCLSVPWFWTPRTAVDKPGPAGSPSSARLTGHTPGREHDPGVGSQPPRSLLHCKRQTF